MFLAVLTVIACAFLRQAQAAGFGDLGTNLFSTVLMSQLPQDVRTTYDSVLTSIGHSLIVSAPTRVSKPHVAAAGASVPAQEFFHNAENAIVTAARKVFSRPPEASPREEVQVPVVKSERSAPPSPQAPQPQQPPQSPQTPSKPSSPAQIGRPAGTVSRPASTTRGSSADLTDRIAELELLVRDFKQRQSAQLDSLTYHLGTGITTVVTTAVSSIDAGNIRSGLLALASGGTGTSTAPSYGQLLMGNVNGSYDLVSTSSLGISGGGGSGITSLGAQYSAVQNGVSQTFATTSDTNIVLTVTSSGNTHTFAPSWAGSLAIARGGTNNTAFPANSLLYFDGTKIAATSSALYSGSYIATTTSASVLPYASTTALTASGAGYVGSLSIGNTATSNLLQVGGSSQFTVNSVGNVVLSSGTQIYMSGGAANNPTLTTPGLNAGIYFPASNVLGFATNGTERARIDSTGSVGLGTTSPSSLFTLAVQGGGLFSGNVSTANVTATGTLTVAGTASSTFAGGIDAARVCITGTTNCLSSLTNGTVTSIATNNGLTGGTITTSGTLGLDLTAIPANNTLLTWNGSRLAATGTQALTAGYFIGTTTTASVFPYASTTIFTSSGTTYLATTAGLVGIGTTSPWAKLAVNPLVGDVNQFVVGSSTATSFLINPAGNVGVGSTTPGTLFTVGGSAYLGNAVGSLVTIQAGTVNYPIQSTTTVSSNFNAYAIASSSNSNGNPVVNVSFDPTGATSTIGFFVATTTGLVAGATPTPSLRP